MTLKAALQADLAAKGLNLGNLADHLGITQQSVSKWIAKDELPKDRIDDVLAIVGPNSHTANFIVYQAQSRVRGSVHGGGVSGKLAAKAMQPGPADDDDGEEVTTISFSEQQKPPVELRRTEMFSGRQAIGRSRVEKWAMQLNAPQRRNVLRVIEIHGALRRFDYLSDKLAIMVRPIPDIDPTRLIHTSVPLMLMKARNPALDCKLVLLPHEELGLPTPKIERSSTAMRIHVNRADMVKQDLMALGINVVEFQSADFLAAMIDTVENPDKGITDVSLFSYENYPEDAYLPDDDDPPPP